jgi:hypothetical protein
MVSSKMKRHSGCKQKDEVDQSEVEWCFRKVLNRIGISRQEFGPMTQNLIVPNEKFDLLPHLYTVSKSKLYCLRTLLAGRNDKVLVTGLYTPGGLNLQLQFSRNNKVWSWDPFRGLSPKCPRLEQTLFREAGGYSQKC